MLTIYTPTYRRPKALERCKVSVALQAPCQHLVITDEVGLGVGGMFADMVNHQDKIEGAYVFVLSDDDWLIDPDFVRDLPGALEQFDYPDILMVRSTIMGSTFPSELSWQAKPELGHVTLSNWVVKREVFCTVPYGARYEGDFDFIRACWDLGLRFAWWDRVVAAAAGWGGGRPE